MRFANQRPMTGAAPTSKSYHRRLLELAAVGIVLGVVFLLFWQGVLRFNFPATWDEQYCKRLLSSYEPAVLTALLAESRNSSGFRLAGVFGNKTVEMLGTGSTVSTCSINIVSDQPVFDGGNMYNCTLAVVRYKTENTTDWLMTGVQTELATEFFGTGDIARFGTTITYYNPATAAGLFASTVEKLNSMSCGI